jgi:hypothetical protein
VLFFLLDVLKFRVLSLPSLTAQVLEFNRTLFREQMASDIVELLLWLGLFLDKFPYRDDCLFVLDV